MDFDDVLVVLGVLLLLGAAAYVSPPLAAAVAGVALIVFAFARSARKDRTP